jgi:hypothetical protein
LRLSVQEIDEVVKEYDNTTRAIKDELLRICWFMRGSISYNECHMLTPDEKIIISKIIEKNLEITKESGLPYF